MYEEEDDDYIDDDLNIDLDGEDYLEEDEILVPESEEEFVDEEYIYEKLKRRNSPYARKIVGNSLTDEIVAKESGGDYRAENPYSSAVGKYQFLWGTWGSKIAQVTGVRSKEEFKNSPEAQDMFYNEYYLPNELVPGINKIKKLAPQIPDKELGKLIHFRGLAGAGKYLRGEVSDKPEAYNSSISSYTGIKMQNGGYNPQELLPHQDMDNQIFQYDPYELMRPKRLNPSSFKTDFKTPDINNNYANALTDKQRQPSSSFNMDGFADTIGDIGNGITKIIDTGKKYSNQIAQGVSSAIDMGEQFTSEQVKNQQYRQMMQRLNEDKTNNYSPVSQRINNNPILI